jgi:hypothetical protein
MSEKRQLSNGFSFVTSQILFLLVITFNASMRFEIKFTSKRDPFIHSLKNFKNKNSCGNIELLTGSFLSQMLEEAL